MSCWYTVVESSYVKNELVLISSAHGPVVKIPPSHTLHDQGGDSGSIPDGRRLFCQTDACFCDIILPL